MRTKRSHFGRRPSEGGRYDASEDILAFVVLF